MYVYSIYHVTSGLWLVAQCVSGTAGGDGEREEQSKHQP